MAKAALIPGEDPKAFATLLRTFRRGLGPKTLEEEECADDECEDEDEEEGEAEPRPKLSAADRAALAMPEDADRVRHLLRYEGARWRNLDRAFDKLRRLQRGRTEARPAANHDNGTPGER